MQNEQQKIMNGGNAAPKVNEPYRDPDDFKLISEEISRQYDVIMGNAQAQIDKIGILLGFILLIIVQVSLTNDLTDHPFNTDSGKVLFNVGLFMLAVAAFISMIQFFVRKYPVGVKISKLLDSFEKCEDVNYSVMISSKMNKSINELMIICTRRASYIKVILICFAMGVLLIVIPRIANW
jgi:hypothetical protein